MVCDNGTNCLSIFKRCDGVYGPCRDKTDEQNCSKYHGSCYGLPVAKGAHRNKGKLHRHHYFGRYEHLLPNLVSFVLILDHNPPWFFILEKFHCTPSLSATLYKPAPSHNCLFNFYSVDDLYNTTSLEIPQGNRLIPEPLIPSL